MTATFVKYSSLTNHYREKEIFNIRVSNNFVDEGWYATEKIHGANFQMGANAQGDAWVGSRTQVVDGQFFNCQPVIDKYREAVIGLCQSLGYSTLIIYGELFGGYYPGMKTTASAVQRGVVYSPHREFLAFDVLADGEWLTRKEIRDLGVDQVVPFVPILFGGLTFDEALALTPEFDSVIPEYLGYPYEGVNGSEGLVIAHYSQKVTDKLGERAVVKKKSTKFAEIKRNGTKGERRAIDDHPLLAPLSEYVTDARYDAVVSKVGEVSIKDMSRLIGLYTLDVLEDAIADEVLPQEYKKVDGYSTLSKQLSKVIVELLKTKL